MNLKDMISFDTYICPKDFSVFSICYSYWIKFDV